MSLVASELESVKAMFNEKEKELSVAVAKVDTLTQQLEEIRNGRLAALKNNKANNPAMIELEKLRQELIVSHRVLQGHEESV